jgi:Family of unknown function (DUF5709)
MPGERRHESQDLEDYQTHDGSDTLDGSPGDDPLDRGVTPPVRWSAAMRFGSTAAEQQAGESLDQLLAEEEPEISADLDDARPEDVDWDENATEEDVVRFGEFQGPDPRSGRLIAALQDGDHPLRDDLLATDTGVDGGGATAEEAAVHVLDDAGQPDSGSDQA